MTPPAAKMKRYTSHETNESGPHVWDQDLEQAALFPTLRDADYGASMLNGGIDRGMYEWKP